MMNEIKTEAPVKVLFVDDEENILRSIKRLLIEESYETLTAGSGEEALKLLRNHQDIGLIVSDQRMPGMQGVDLLKQASEISPDTLRIMLTGYADINAAIDAINRGGACRYITKPWRDDELIQIIREAVHRYSLTRENKRLTEIVRKQNEELKSWNDQLQYFVQEQTIEIQNKNKELQEMNRKLRENFKKSILAFSELIELRNRAVRNHSKNVAEISLKVATKMAVSGEEMEILTAASLLHDIGKIGIPDVLLLKDFEEMNPDEQKEYMLHPIRGQIAVDSIEDLRRAGTLIRHHHEWYNGTGFPDGLREKEIPLGSKIIAMADFVDRTFGKIQGDNAFELTLNKVKEELDKRFDHKLYPYLEASFKEIYSNILPKTGEIEMELYPIDLRVGMVLSKDVRSGTGLLLLSKGMKFNEINIQSLKRYYQLDPSKKGIFVWVKR